MKYTFVLYLVFVCKGISGTEGKSGADETKWPEKEQHYPFIINGTSASLTDAPWYVQLSLGAKDFFCSGAILNRRTVITAAHCVATIIVDGRVATIQPSRLTIIYGTINIIDLSRKLDFGKSVKVDRIIANPLFLSNNNSQNDGDIALLITKTAIELNNSTVKAVSLPDATSKPPNGTNVLAVGFGVTKEDGAVSKTLQKIVIQIQDQDTCVKQYSKVPGAAVTERMICAAAPGKDTCQGDSGGPVTIKGNNTLVGVVSYAVGCARPDFYGVNTRVSKFLKFINDNKVE